MVSFLYGDGVALFFNTNPSFHAVNHGTSVHLMKKNAKRRRSKQQVIADRENARRQEELVQAKLQKYDALENKYRSLAKKVKEEDVINAQVHSLFQAGILNQDENGNLVVAGGISLAEFQDCEKSDEDMPEHDPRQKKKRYKNIRSEDDPNAQYQGDQSAFDNT